MTLKNTSYSNIQQIELVDENENWQVYVDAETFEILEILSAMSITTNQQLKGKIFTFKLYEWTKNYAFNFKM